MKTICFFLIQLLICLDHRLQFLTKLYKLMKHTKLVSYNLSTKVNLVQLSKEFEHKVISDIYSFKFARNQSLDHQEWKIEKTLAL